MFSKLQSLLWRDYTSTGIQHPIMAPSRLQLVIFPNVAMGLRSCDGKGADDSVPRREAVVVLLVQSTWLLLSSYHRALFPSSVVLSQLPSACRVRAGPVAPESGSSCPTITLCSEGTLISNWSTRPHQLYFISWVFGLGLWGFLVSLFFETSYPSS